MPTKQITVDFETLLDTIDCASDYGFPHSVFYSQMAELLGHTLTDAEIEKHATDLSNTEGYDKEDYHKVKENLQEFRERFINPEKSTRKAD